MADFNQELDRGGRYHKVYKVHVQPDKEWREEHFTKRYRLGKDRVTDIALDFGPYSRTDGTCLGGGLSHFQQVSYHSYILNNTIRYRITCIHIKN